MWPFLPKKCDCSETPTNPGTSCNASGLTTSDIHYDGINGECTSIETGMSATEVFQQLDYFLCSDTFTQYILNQIENNPEEYPEFITLVNGAINCTTIDNCGPPPPPTTTTTSSSTSTSTTSTTSTSSTTTTTTTVAETCYTYTLTAITDNGNWTAESCFGGTVGGILPFAGNTVITPCIINTSLVLNGITVTNNIKCEPTTTTTSSTSTSTSSTTSTTTTICPCTYINITVAPGYIAFSDTNSIDVQYENCNGDTVIQTYTAAGTYTICSQDINSIIASIVIGGVTNIVTVGPINTNELCCTPSTTTTSTTEPTTCMEYYVFAKFPTEVAFTYFPCLGGPESAPITLSTDPGSGYPSSTTVCCFPGTEPISGAIPTLMGREIGDPCGL
jgi:hypothetical protein